MVNPESKVNEAHRRKRLHLARLEADVAYFQARLEMIGQPESANQLAQCKVFLLLHEAANAEVIAAEQAVSELYSRV